MNYLHLSLTMIILSIITFAVIPFLLFVEISYKKHLKKLKKLLKPTITSVIAFLMFFTGLPLNVLAAELNRVDPITININGEAITINPPRRTGPLIRNINNDFVVPVTANGETFVLELPQYVHLDGVPIPIDDEYIIITPITPSERARNISEIGIEPLFIVTFNFGSEWFENIQLQPGSTTAVPGLSTITFSYGGQTRTLHPHRYFAYISVPGLEDSRFGMEIYCIDPTKMGPGDGGGYTLFNDWVTHAWATDILRRGFPNNPATTGGNADDQRRWAYRTRYHIGRHNPENNFTNWNFGSNSESDFDLPAYQDLPAILVNGDANHVQVGTTPTQTFNVTYNTRFNIPYNPFVASWPPDGSMPSGALIIDGTEYPFSELSPQKVFSNISSFQIRVDNPDEVAMISLYTPFFLALAGSDQVMEFRPNNETTFQRLLGLVPFFMHSVSYSWTEDETEIPEPTPTPPNGTSTPPPPTSTPTQPPSTSTPPPYEPNETQVRIQKINALTRENIPGALVRLRGMSSHQVITGDGQMWEIDNTGINTSQVLTSGAYTALPSPNVTSEVGDGIWTLTNLPWGFYMVEEERAPDGYSLLPQHTAYGFWLLPPNVYIDSEDGETFTIIEKEPNENHILITFENYPFGEVVVYKHDEETNEPLPNAHFRIQGFFVEGNAPVVIDMTLITDNDGRVVFQDLPAGSYTVSEVQAPPGYMLSEPNFQSVDISWGQRADDPNRPAPILRFYNIPMATLEVFKVDGVTHQALPGARFRLSGLDQFGTQGTWEAETDEQGIAKFEGPFIPNGTYILEEIYPPIGYVLQAGPREIVMRSGRNEVTWENWQNPGLTIIKRDANTQETLPGAVFEVVYENGQTVAGSPFTTDENGEIFLDQTLFEGQAERTLIITEIIPPPGYALSTPNSQTVTMRAGENNIVTFFNLPNPGLTIEKRDLDNPALLLPDAVFTIEYENGQTLSNPNGGDWRTDENGQIFIPQVLFTGDQERTLIITEIIPPPGYSLSEPNWQRITLRAGEDNTVTFYNRRRPYLELTKRDSITGTAIANAEFTIEKLDQPGAGMLTGNPFRTDENGRIRWEELPPGIYRITETRAANNYWFDPMEQNRSWTIEIRANEDYHLLVENTLLPSLVITKMNALTYQPVPLTQFRVEYEVPNSGNVIILGHFLTDSHGRIILPFVQPGWYRVTETRAAPGMALNSNNSYRVYLAPGQNTYQLIQDGLISYIFGLEVANTVEIPPIPEQNEPLPPEEIEPNPPPQLSGIAPTFEDAQNMTEEQIREMVAGRISVSDGNQYQTGDDVWNWPLNSIIIKKTDITTGRLLSGATFELIHISAGVSGTLGTVIGMYTTTHTGVIVITGLEPGTYAVRETQAPPNYVLSVNNTQHGYLMPDGHTILELEFSNYPYGSLLVTLRDEVTGLPLQNGEFRVQDSSGAVVGTGNGIFRTNAQGEFLVPNLPPGSYVVTQILAPDGYTFGSVAVPQTIFIPADGQTYFLDFTNRPYSGLVIRKIDAFSNDPIPGARFNVTRVNGELIGEFITDHNGLIEIDGLLGWFVVREIEVPYGFEFDPQTVRNVEIRPQARSIETFVSARLGSLIIEVIDEFGSPLAGATVVLRNQNGEFIGTFVTPASGLITVPNLQSDWYYVEQTIAPPGYTMVTPGLSIRVYPETVARAVFVNRRNPGIFIEKVDGSGNPLMGAEFEVRTATGTLIQRVVTNVGGTASVFNLAPGVYQIIESRSPPGFVAIDGTQTVDLQAGETATVRFINELMPTIIIEKIDESGNPLAGAVFEVRTITGTRVAEVTTNTGGQATVTGLQPGSYEVIETRPPLGYVLDTASQTVLLVPGQTATVRFVNRLEPTVIIEKVDNNGNPLANAEFEVRRIDGELVARVTSNTGGVAIVTGLGPGSYTITESRAPAGYIITEQTQTINLAAGQSATVRFVNLPAPGLTIEKVDNNGNPLANAEFEVRRPNGELVERVLTAQGGTANLPNLEPGVYIITETRAPAGFVITEQSQTITMVAGQNQVVRFVNFPAPGLTIEKVDNNGIPLANAEFEVRLPNGELVERVTTTQGGTANLPNLEPGTYIITETRAPAGFVITEQSQTVTMVAGQNQTVRFVNFPAPSLTIEKVDGDGNPLANAEFEVRTATGTLLHRVTTNQGGVAIITDLEPGTYEIIETRAPPGFVITESSQIVEFVAGESYTVRFVNFFAPGLTIEKVDPNGNPLANAEFEVRTPGGELVHRVVTTQGGTANIPNLAPGTYIVTETRAPPGFVITEQAQTIVMVAGQNQTVRFVNFPVPSLIIEKVDENGVPLANAEFEIRTLGGELVARVTTDMGGHASVPELAPGSYQIIETRAPPGFAIAETSRTVEFVAGQTRTERFVNYRLSTYVIHKIDGETNLPIEGVIFEISTLAGLRIRNFMTGGYEFVTDNAGMVRLPELDAGTYVATETRPQAGYAPIAPHIFQVGYDMEYIITIRNYRLTDMAILKIDGDTQAPMAGVQFEIAHDLGNGTAGELLINPATMTTVWTTDNAGRIALNVLPNGRFIAIETRTLDGYALAEPVLFTVESGSPQTIIIHNYRLSDISLLKLDGTNDQPLQGVRFEIARDVGGGVAGERLINPVTNTIEWTTDNAGRINLNSLESGQYIAIETQPLTGYIAGEPTLFTVQTGVNQTIIIRNYPLTDIAILKLDGDTDEPLQGVVFEIARDLGGGMAGERLLNPVTNTTEWITDNAGRINLNSLQAGQYIAIETRPLTGYTPSEPTLFTVQDGVQQTIIIRNYLLTDITLLKIDGDTEQPLQGVRFEIARDMGGGLTGERLINPLTNTTEWITDSTGRINLNSLQAGQYMAIEIQPPIGYIASEPTLFSVQTGVNQTIIVRNFRLTDIAILKVDGDTQQPLAGVRFEIAHDLGNGQAGERLLNPSDLTTVWTTDNTGRINLNSLPIGRYLAIELQPLDGYTAAHPTLFTVESGVNRVITIENFRHANLVIRKINSVTREPIEGVVFELTHLRGDFASPVRNPETGFFEFVTDRNGLIYLPAIEDGAYFLTETRPAAGFHPLTEPILIQINSETRPARSAGGRQEYLLVVENIPASGLLIVKTDGATGEPLAGVEFEIRHADGRLVQGSIADQNQPGTPVNSPQMTATGGFVTDAHGRILLNHLTPGVYHVTEVRALPGYQLDQTVHVVTITPGYQAVLEVVNHGMGGVRLLKVDAVTGSPIYNVEFMIFDRNNNVMGVFYTDNNGIIDLAAILPPGRYTIRETRPAPGYFSDDIPRTIEFTAGQITEIRWENVPMAGQLQITKVSADDNQLNGLPAGTPLQGAVFEIFEYRTGNLVDRIESNNRGIAVSRPLPIGRYFAVEVTAPQFYSINREELHFDVEFATQIIRATFVNYSANIGVNIDKTAPREIMQGNQMTYEIRNIRNESSVPLGDFFWRDILPTEAVRAHQLVTGTFNADIRYNVRGITNLGNEFIIADNLSSARNNVIELGPAHLGLAQGEILTEFSVHFGQVPAGFTMVENAQVIVNVIPRSQTILPNGMIFANRVDVGGMHGIEWVIGNSTAGTTIFGGNERIPQTGW